MPGCTVDGCTGDNNQSGMCWMHYRRARRSKTNDPGPPGPLARPRLPADPIVEVVEGRGGIRAALGAIDGRAYDRCRQAYHRARSTGTLTPDAADMLAIAIGRDVIELYGKQWWAIVD